MKKLLLFAIAVIFTGSMMAQFSVTMNVDMTDVEGFNPEAQDVYVSGSIFGWPQPGTNSDLKLTPTEANPMIYTISASLEEAGEIQYKYFLVVPGTPSWDNGEWTGDPNRTVFAVNTATLNDVFGDKPWAVTFNVDMTNAEGFDPAAHQVYMAGTINVANNWQEPGNDPSLMMSPSGVNPLVYTLTKWLYAGSYQYKYFSTHVAAGWAGGEWDGDPNREVTVAEQVAFNDVWAVQPGVGDEIIIADFEDGTTGPLTLNVMGCGEWDNQELHPVEETFTIIDNPDPSGMNTSAKVMQFNRRGTADGGLPWGGFWAFVEPNFDVSVHKYVHIMVWKSRISPIKFKLENGPSGTLEAPSSNEQTLTGEWIDMVFDFSSMEGAYPVIAFMPDFEDPLTISNVEVIYFDNIRINSDPNPYSAAGIKNYTSIPSIAVYPNPATSVLNITVNENLQSVEIYNLLGQVQMTFNTVNPGTLTINTSDLPKGIYMIVTRDEQNNKGTAKFVKE